MSTPPTVPDKEYRQRQLIAIFWFIAIILGAFQAWDSRHTMLPDFISYLDIGDAYFSGDWKMAINAFWPPLYSWLLGLAMIVLKPSPYWEFSVVHLVHFLNYLFALACFHFFLLELIHYHRHQSTGLSSDGHATLPVLAFLSLGYTLFIWSSLNLIGIQSAATDMCVAAVVYFVSGLLLRIRRGLVNGYTFALLGAVLGLGYLAKTFMFAFAFIFMGIGIFSVGHLRKAIPYMLITLIAFLLVGGPFIVAISKATGRLTFGESGKLNYSFHVNGIPYIHWQGRTTGNGTPKHPTRKVFDVPAVFEFKTPIGGTYPPWYDPSYWNEGATPHFDLRQHIRLLRKHAKLYFDIFVLSGGSLIGGFIILCFISRRRWLCIKDIAKQWNLLVPAFAALGLLSLVHVEQRHIAPFVVLVWMGIFSGIRLPKSDESKRLATWVAIAIVTIMTIIIIFSPTLKFLSITGQMIRGINPWPHVQWNIADNLKQMRVRSGDKVACIGDSFDAYWARLARVKIVAEIPQKDVNHFWAADSQIKSQVLQTFSKTGAKLIVTKNLPDYASQTGWQKIENTNYHVYILSKME